MRGKVVIVEGLIGGGKTSFSRELGDALGKESLLLLEPDEKEDANPYLADFYEDKERWAFTMQVHLLQMRFRMHQHAQWHAMQGYGHAVLDRSYVGDTCFARLQLRSGKMTQREYDTYCSIYQAMTASVMLPNVCIRLVVPPKVAAKRIVRRMEREEGRKCESVIDLGYLKALDQEITHMADVMQRQGVTVMHVPWDVDRDSAELRRSTVEGLAETIKNMQPVDALLDMHRRRP